MAATKNFASSSLAMQLGRLKAGILAVLIKARKPLEEDEIIALTEIKNISEFGWGIAFQELEYKNRAIVFINKKYELTDEVKKQLKKSK